MPTSLSTTYVGAFYVSAPYTNWMDTLGKRIKFARTVAKLKQHEVAAHFGIDRVNVSQWESDTTKPEIERLPALAEILNTSIGWLIDGLGIGPVEKPRPRVVSSYDPDEHGNSDADEHLEEPRVATIGGDVANLAIRGGMGLGSIEEIVRTDHGEIYADHVNGFWTFPDVVKAGWRNMPHVYSVPVTGDSMEPTLTSGSYVFIDMTHVIPSPPDIYACDYGDGLMIKRLQLIPRTDKVLVMSDNERYTNYELLRQDVRVYGRVVAWFQWRG